MHPDAQGMELLAASSGCPTFDGPDYFNQQGLGYAAAVVVDGARCPETYDIDTHDQRRTDYSAKRPGESGPLVLVEPGGIEPPTS